MSKKKSKARHSHVSPQPTLPAHTEKDSLQIYFFVHNITLHYVVRLGIGIQNEYVR